jgi:lipoate-protein ligase A
MKLFDLGELPWKQTQLIYHALGTCGEESIVICTPKEEYACVGFHQDITQELDIEFCKNQDIGVFRREIGGGTVFLDQNQIFYQIIVNRDKAPFDQRVLFKRFLEPVIQTYKELGIKAKYNPVSDLVVNGKKISGNGGGDIGSCKVMTGSILLDFDNNKMCQLLNLPSEKFRRDVCLAMKNNLTTIKNELGYIPEVQEIKSTLISNCERMFGTLEISEIDSTINKMIDELDKKFSDDFWLFKKMKHPKFRSIKIIEGINLIYLTKDNIELCIETKNEEIHNIEFYSTHQTDWKLQMKEKLLNKNFDELLILDTINETQK